MNTHYKISGTGISVVLIHGFVEDCSIWGNFAEKLSEFSKVINLDLPGHGKSIDNKPINSLEDYVAAVKEILDKENIEKAVIVGHSMGGYISLAFADMFPEKLLGFCLFHSVPFADSDEKKQARENMIKEISEGRKEALLKVHAKNIYAPHNVSKYEYEIKQGFNVANNMSNSEIIASIRAMKNRPDRSKIYKNLKVPALYIIGKQDNFISSDILEKIEMPENNDILILENSGHAGFVEETDKSIEMFKKFIKKCSN